MFEDMIFMTMLLVESTRPPGVFSWMMSASALFTVALSMDLAMYSATTGVIGASMVMTKTFFLSGAGAALGGAAFSSFFSFAGSFGPVAESATPAIPASTRSRERTRIVQLDILRMNRVSLDYNEGVSG